MAPEPVQAEPVEPAKEPIACVEQTREPSDKKVPSVSSLKKVPSVTTKLKPLQQTGIAREPSMVSSRGVEEEAATGKS